MSQDYVIGQCKWFSDKLGYGYITVVQPGPLMGKDVFVHHSGLLPHSSAFKTLTKGEYVHFKFDKGQNGRDQACSVMGVFGGTLMCDNMGFRPSATNIKNRNVPPLNVRDVQAIDVSTVINSMNATVALLPQSAATPPSATV